MAGTSQRTASIITVVGGQSQAAVTAAQVLSEHVTPVRAEIGAICANADTAGTGSGTTVLDVLVNGTSIWPTTGNRPTLAATSTGAFANLTPGGVKALRPGDVLQLICASVSSTGHAGVALSVALNTR